MMMNDDLSLTLTLSRGERTCSRRVCEKEEKTLNKFEFIERNRLIYYYFTYTYYG